MTDMAAETEKHFDKRKALGRGLDSLLPAGPRMVPGVAAGGMAAGGTGEMTSGSSALATEDHSGVVAEMHAAAAPKDTVQQIALDLIDGNPYQTRIEFDT